MLKKILSGGDCARCRICCNFYKEEIWEMPSVSGELKTLIKEKYDIDAEYRELSGNTIFGGDFGENGLLLCPMLGENGCILGDDKPFECKVWPFRVMDKEGEAVITVSPLCKEVNKLSAEQLEEFAESELKTVFETKIKKYPNIIKPYIEGYPIAAFLR